jgi:predicted HTH domain antitoxin
MTITIPDEFLFAARMTEQEMAAELAIVMYRHGAASLESAADVARMGRRQFACLLASRDIEVDSVHLRADQPLAAGGRP